MRERCYFQTDPGPPQDRGGVKAVMIAVCTKRLAHRRDHRLRPRWEEAP